jgi:16S rRNA (cytosine1402-N4)-methyltransferase
MRMSQEGLSAYDVVNSYSQEDLTRILRDYSEEKFASKIAYFIVKERENAPIETTGELVEIIKKAIPAAARREGGHPGKRTFQAIRIEVNNELGVLRQCISDSFDRLSNGGRFCIITFHSLEDRITKQMFAEFTKGCTCPPEFPVCVCGNKPKAKLVSRKPIEPSKAELEANNRSRSSKLRVLEKIVD